MRSQAHHSDMKDISGQHDRRALMKSGEILSFLIGDVAYVTQENFEYCIHCIRTFIEATVMQQSHKPLSKSTNSRNAQHTRKATSSHAFNSDYSNEQSKHSTAQARDDSNEDEDIQESIKQEYQSLALQLLDLMYTLHTGASQIYKRMPTDQSKASVLWFKCWCPTLQGESLPQTSLGDQCLFHSN